MTTAAPLNVTAAHNFSPAARREYGDHFQIESPSTNTYIPRGDTHVTLNYFMPPEDGSIPFNQAGDNVEHPPAGEPQRNYGDIDVKVPIKDIRGHESEYTLDEHAFMVVPNLPESAEKEFTDDESIKKNYYPEVEKVLLDHVPGSNKIFIFDHTVRRSNPNAPRAPVTRVHIDQTVKSATARVRYHLPDEAEELLKGRFRLINIWRPLNGPVQANPLGFASTSSLRNEDLIPVEHRYPDRIGETAGIVYNPGQKWHYLSGMRNDERLFLECFDSEALKPGTKVLGGRVPHTAFRDERTPEGAIGRESIEVRALVFGP